MKIETSRMSTQALLLNSLDLLGATENRGVEVKVRGFRAFGLEQPGYAVFYVRSKDRQENSSRASQYIGFDKCIN